MTERFNKLEHLLNPLYDIPLQEQKAKEELERVTQRSMLITSSAYVTSYPTMISSTPFTRPDHMNIAGSFEQIANDVDQIVGRGAVHPPVDDNDQGDDG